MSDPHDSSPAPHVRKVGEAVEVPVYNCRVYVAPPDAAGLVVARAVTLAGVIGQGRTEREALQQVVAAFKQRIVELRASGEPVAWLEPPSLPPGQQERWIAVHL
jgi:hypothetical protein